MRKIIIILAATVLLAGCGTLEGKLENVLVTSLPGDRAFSASLYGPFGFTSEFRKSDAEELKRLRALAAASAASAATAASAP